MNSAQKDKARASYDEAIAIYRDVDDALGEANCLMAFGDIARREGEYAAAQDYYKEALTLYEKVQDKFGCDTSIRKLAELQSLPAQP